MTVNKGRPQADGVILGTHPGHAAGNKKGGLNDVILTLGRYHEIFCSLDERSRFSTPDPQIRTESLPDYQFYWLGQAAVVRVLRGKARITVDIKEYHIGSGDWVYIPNSLRYRLLPSEAGDDLQFITAAVNEDKSV